MAVTSLGYVIIEATEPERWRQFAGSVLGLMPAEPGPDGSMRWRIDERPFRIAVVVGNSDRFVSAGWEFRDSDALEACIASLHASDVPVRVGSESEAANRLAKQIVFCSDPCGNQLEL